MAGVKLSHLKFSQYTNSIFMIRKINWVFSSKCNSVDNNNLCTN